MKKKQIIVGIDVSKSTLDVYVRVINHSFTVENGPKGFSSLLETICKKAQCKHHCLFQPKSVPVIQSKSIPF